MSYVAIQQESESEQEAEPLALCDYPPRAEIEVGSQGIPHDGTSPRDGNRYVVKGRCSQRYFSVGVHEYRLLGLIDGTRTIDDLATHDLGGPRPSRTALIRFLARLDSLGVLARGSVNTAGRPSERSYSRVALLDPTSLLTRCDTLLGWVFSSRGAILCMLLVATLATHLLNRTSELAEYGAYAYSRYGVVPAIVLVLLIAVTHELAHGVACKHFGGEVREMGVVLVLGVLPSLYCNVTDLYRFPRRSHRLWVIFAGIYWQLVVSAIAALIWLVTVPYTAVADLAFLALFAGSFNLLINCNPLIKLDGYYALCQLIGVPNLQKRSFHFVSKTIRRIALGPHSDAGLSRRPEPLSHKFLFVGYWLLSIGYSIGLVWFGTTAVSASLMDWFGFGGVLLSIALVLTLSQRLWKPAARAVTRKAISFLAAKDWPGLRFALAAGGSGFNTGGFSKGGLAMSDIQPDDTKERAGERSDPGRSHPDPESRTGSPWRRRSLKVVLPTLAVAALVAPWEASTGSDCTLLLPPGRESAARSNTDAVLAEVRVQPGDFVNSGETLARVSNPEIEDRLTQLNSEIARLAADASRIEDELRVRHELARSASLKERERRELADEMRGELALVAKSASTEDGGATLPASLAVLQSEVELKKVELNHNRLEVDRYRKLLDQDLVGAQLYDTAVSAMRISEKELERAAARLQAALTEHRRLANGAETGSLVAEAEARAARASFEALIAELHSNRSLLEAVKERRDIVQREHDLMNIVAPRSGVVLGEDLRKLIGKRYGRGEEIFRIADLEKFLLNVEVNEREIADVRLDSPVRFKLKMMPGRTFTGRVSRISAEPIVNQYGQRFYAVEVLVDNNEGILRPGMSGFARISFGRQPIALILGQKVWQALRPELWLF